MARYFAAAAMLPGGWANDVLIETDDAGNIAGVMADSRQDGAARLAGPVLPGMPNVHSHAFQRLLAGTTERRNAAGRDTFWTWRERMYGIIAKIEPPDLEAIATWVYTEMLKSGYTAVAEFHYLFHAPGGERYENRTETSERILAAAARSGIGLTLLPALYSYPDFGVRKASSEHRRFTLNAEEFCDLWDALAVRIAENPQFTLGVAPHSLRAVSPEDLNTVVAHVHKRNRSAPVHIHIAEQQKEVDACIAWSGQRPLAWLLENAPVSASWCLVHATHVDDHERTSAAKTGAVVAVCPTTEANLGDGVFAAQAWMGDGGRIAIGSDSQVTIDPAEELRWLEYGQRLMLQRRAVLCSDESPSVGGTVYRAALAGGARALGRRIGRIAPGFRADLVVLDGAAFDGVSGDGVLDRYIFGGVHDAVRDVMVGGRWLVANRRSSGESGAKLRYVRTLSRLSES